MFAKLNIKNITKPIKKKVENSVNVYVRKKTQEGCKTCPK